jgi:hypothetical protein
MYYHDRKSGLVLGPLGIILLLVWRNKGKLLLFGIAANAIAPLLWLAIPKEGYLASRNTLTLEQICVRDGLPKKECQSHYGGR